MRKFIFAVCLVLFGLLAAGCQPAPAAAPTDPPAPMNTTAPTDPPPPTATTAPTPTRVEGPIEIRWALRPKGGYPDAANYDRMVKVIRTLADRFNEQHAGKIKVSVVEFNKATPPDLVGPAMMLDVEGFSLLDLAPYLEAAGLTAGMSAPQVLNANTLDGQGVVGIPVFVPSALLLYNKTAFEEAGLNLPPSAYGELYTLPDGQEVEWSFETVAWVARRLTLDRAGKNATEEGFDRTKIARYGFALDDQLAYFGQPIYTKNGPITSADSLKAGWSWLHAGAFGEQPFIQIQGAPFGQAPMFLASTFDLYLVRTTATGIAPVPALDGQVYQTPVVMGESFFILADSPHEETVALLAFILAQDELAELCHWQNCLGQLSIFTRIQEKQYTDWAAKMPFLQENDFRFLSDGLAHFPPLFGHTAQLSYLDFSNGILRQFTTKALEGPDSDLDALFAEMEAALQKDAAKLP